MAALVAGVQYGLSSHSNFHENKSLIFVKLTDSAQRAIEDFLRNRNKTSQNPTIQFLGNEGQLSFPSTQSSHGSAGFTFSLSGNQDIEGPQGGFECIQQTGPKSLESLGTLPCKMRIQANDDVYETTRHRMAVAEENNKNKCTRVIKANGPDIGRKVKVKGTGRTIPPPANARHRESTTIPASGTQQSRFSSYKPITSNPPVVRAQPEKKVSDIMRRPLKERLIHLLALRPYKKPELYDRISREGIKERERSIMTTTLKQVAYMRDNTYHLHRHVWNDVQEDWPFYSEQEKAMLKRRKPQNLTPPGSSDGGSSGSGQSPNSTHPGSPPAITAPPLGLPSSKRPGYYQGNDGLPTKRPRISHYRKPEPNSTTATTTTTSSSSSSSSSSIGEIGRTTGGSNGGSVVVGGGGGGGGGVVGDSNSWDQRQQLYERGDYRAEKTLNSEVLRGSYGPGKPCLTPSSDCEDNNHHSSLSSSHNSHNSLTHHNVISNQHNGNSNNNKLIGSGESSAVNNFPRSGGGSSATGYSGSPNDVLGDRRDREDRGRERDRDRERSASGTTVNYNDVSNLGRAGYAGNGASNNYGSSSSSSSSVCSSCGRSSSAMPDSTKTTEYPDYLTYYTTISSTEQRRRYKEEFNADYEEYRRLHAQVEKVSKRFAQLEEQFKRESASGNVEKLEAIKHQTYNEYMETKRDPVYRETKKRFDYLHEKLSHIKRLILEYDTQNGSGSSSSGGGGGGSSSSNGGGGGGGAGENCNGLHY